MRQPTLPPSVRPTSTTQSEDEADEPIGTEAEDGTAVADGGDEAVVKVRKADLPVNEVLVAIVRARRLPAVDKSLMGKASSDPQV